MEQDKKTVTVPDEFANIMETDAKAKSFFKV
jgi:hypothetical protein